MYLVGIYVAAILIFGGIYVTVGNMTKVRYMDVLKEGLGIRAKIRANKKEMKVIAKTIRGIRTRRSTISRNSMTRLPSSIRMWLRSTGKRKKR